MDYSPLHDAEMRKFRRLPELIYYLFTIFPYMIQVMKKREVEVIRLLKVCDAAQHVRRTDDK